MPALGVQGRIAVRSLERCAVDHIGIGPVLAIDIDDVQCLGAIAARGARSVVFDNRPSVIAQYSLKNPATYKIAVTDQRFSGEFPSIVLGTGAFDNGLVSYAARLKQAVRMLAPAGRLVACLPSRMAGEDTVREAIAQAAHNREFQLRTTPSNGGDGDELVLITRRSARAAVARLEGSRSGDLDGSIAAVNEQITKQFEQNGGPVIFAGSSSSVLLPPDIVIRHKWPAKFERPQARHYIHMQPWEFGSLLKKWQAGLEVVDEVWCYTRYVADVYMRAGYPAERLHIMPLGFDPQVYFPAHTGDAQKSRESTCIFTFLGGLIRRKGADLAIEAYARAFTADDNVCLFIKGSGGTSFYSQQDEVDLFAPLRDRANAPRCAIVNEHFREQDVAELYRGSTALLAPFRGEGFGLPALEAMACGTPVVYTAGGAMDDFISSDYGYPISSSREYIHAESLNLGPMIEDGFFLRPDPDELAATLRHIYEHRTEAWKLGAQAASVAHHNLTWNHTAKRMQFRLAQIAEDLGLSV